MKTLDSMAIEALARFVIGENCAGFEYRSNAKIDEFLRRASPPVERQPGGRKQSVIDLFNTFNDSDVPGDDGSDSVHPALDAIICRLVDPREFHGDEGRLKAALNELNLTLGMEGLTVTLDGITPKLESVQPHLRPAGSGSEYKCPDFIWLTTDQALIDNLNRRWKEAESCVTVGAHLATVLMLGSILEAVLLVVIKDHPEVANRSAQSPKEGGKVKHFRDWTLHDCIEVASDCAWIQGDRHRFSHALRESRNLIHAHAQMMSGEWPDARSCRICWHVVYAAIEDVVATYRSEATSET